MYERKDFQPSSPTPNRNVIAEVPSSAPSLHGVDVVLDLALTAPEGGLSLAGDRMGAGFDLASLLTFVCCFEGRVFSPPFEGQLSSLS